MDVIAAFLEERCELDPDNSGCPFPTRSCTGHTGVDAGAGNPQPLTVREFIGEMQRAEYTLVKVYAGSGKKVDRWQGLRLRGEHE